MKVVQQQDPGPELAVLSTSTRPSSTSLRSVRAAALSVSFVALFILRRLGDDRDGELSQ